MLSDAIDELEVVLKQILVNFNNFKEIYYNDIKNYRQILFELQIYKYKRKQQQRIKDIKKSRDNVRYRKRIVLKYFKPIIILINDLINSLKNLKNIYSHYKKIIKEDFFEKQIQNISPTIYEIFVTSSAYYKSLLFHYNLEFETLTTDEAMMMMDIDKFTYALNYKNSYKLLSTQFKNSSQNIIDEVFLLFLRKIDNFNDDVSVNVKYKLSKAGYKTLEDTKEIKKDDVYIILNDFKTFIQNKFWGGIELLNKKNI
jgi:hypothetical protein